MRRRLVDIQFEKNEFNNHDNLIVNLVFNLPNISVTNI